MSKETETQQEIQPSEQVGEPRPDWVETVARNLAAEKLFAVVTVLTGEAAGTKLIVYPDGSCEGQPLAPGLHAQVIDAARAGMQQELSATHTFGDAEAFIEVYAPRPKLVIVGGVHTAIPLSRYAKILGFRVIVVDGRARFATPERFPDADEVIVEWPDEALPRLGIDASTYVVILTHDPKFDLPALKALSGTPARYVGAMGSRETRLQHMEQLRAEGVPSEFLNSVYGPVGLDLGARTPEEVALAIMAEIIAVRYGRPGGHLKNQ